MFPIEEGSRQSFTGRRNPPRARRLASAILAIAFVVPLIAGSTEIPALPPHIQGTNLRIEFDRQLRSRVVARFDKKETLLGPFTASETITSGNQPVSEFSLSSQALERIDDAFGSGERLSLEGKHGTLTKRVSVTVYNDFPGMAFFDVQYTNTAAAKVTIDGWSNNAYTVNSQAGSSSPAFWSYQGGSYEKRPNWVLPLQVNFQQENYLGMNDSDYGGGTPIVDVWRRDVGIAVGHVDTKPRLVSLPVTMPNATQATVAVHFKKAITLDPGESFHTLRTFVAVHEGDYFRTLVEYRRFMVKQGFAMAKAPDDAYGAIWCALGIWPFHGAAAALRHAADCQTSRIRLGNAR